VTSSLFFLSTLNYDARSTTHQIYPLFSSMTLSLVIQLLTVSVQLSM